ncbi:MAG: hypothetical protein AB2A00_27185 [Myxococcota bacterium]
MRKQGLVLMALLGCTGEPATPSSSDASVPRAPTVLTGLPAVTFTDGSATLTLPTPSDSISGWLHLSNAPLDVRLEVEGWQASGVVLVGADAGRPLTEAELLWTEGTGLGVVGPCRTRAGYGAAAFGCPNSSNPLWPPGEHVVTLRATQRTPDGGMPWTGTVEAEARFRLGPEPDTVTLHVRLHLPDGVGAENTVFVQRSIQRVAYLLGPAGLEVEVELATSPRAELVVDAVTLRSGALWDLLGVLEPRDGLDVFMLDTLDAAYGDDVLVPIASMVTSVPVAGGRVSLASLILVQGHWRNDDPDEHLHIGTLIAHEMGHALGLFHPLERAAPDGTYVADPISDTTDEPGETADYLMHHTPLSRATVVTPDQARILRLSPNAL